MDCTHIMYSAVVGLLMAILLLILQCDSVKGQPQLVGDIPDQQKRLGDTVEIDCRVRNKGNQALYWIQLDWAIPYQISSDETIQVHNPLYADNSTKYEVKKIINGNNTLTYRLTIQRLVANDAGRYKCAIVLGGDSSTWPSKVGVVNIAGVCHTCPRIVAEMGPTAGRVNTSVTLECLVAQKGNNVVRWKKDTDNLEISNEGNIIPSNPEIDGKRKYEMNIDTTTYGDRYRLKINRLTVGDTGTYRCYVVIPSHSNVFTTGVLTVEVPPSLSASETSFIKQETQSVTMTCTTDGIPTPTITWYRRDGHPLPGGSQNFPGSSFPITDIKKDDRGVYTCSANNGVPPNPELYITLVVEFTPTAKARMSEVSQAIGFTATLECNFEGYPVITPAWYKGSGATRISLVDGGRYIMTNTTGNGIHSQLDQVNAKIKIRELVTADFGEYRCEGRNANGAVASAIITLIESDHCIGCPITPPPETPPPQTTKTAGASPPTNISTTTPIPVSTKEGLCRDKLPDCHSYGNGSCYGIFEDWARENCPAYCGYCPPDYIEIPPHVIGDLACPGWKLPRECEMRQVANCCPIPDCPADYELTAIRKRH